MEIKQLQDRVDGFTTNPSLIAKSGLMGRSYHEWCRDAVDLAGGLPISLELLDAQDVDMGMRLHELGDNVWVKVPAITITGTVNVGAIRTLVHAGIRVNVTCVCAMSTLELVLQEHPHVISCFMGRTSDSGIDPISQGRVMHRVAAARKASLLWAGVRTAYDWYRAMECRFQYVTMPVSCCEAYWKRRAMTAQQLELEVLEEFNRAAQALK